MAKFNKDSVLGTFTVIIAFCLACSVIVSSAVVALGPTQKAAVVRDRQISVLKVAGVEYTSKNVSQQYEKFIKARLVDLETGKFVEDSSIDANSYDFASLAKQADTQVAIPADKDYGKIRFVTKYMPVFEVLNAEDQSKVDYYIIPFYGQALWSTAYGYLRITTDGKLVKAITFYSHGETPGLGGEIDNPMWQAKWVDKRIYNDANEFGINITKTPDHTGEGKDFDIDSLSGATLTAVGIQNAAKYWLDIAYRPFLTNLQAGGNQ